MPGPGKRGDLDPVERVVQRDHRDTHRDDDAKGKVDDGGEHNQAPPNCPDHLQERQQGGDVDIEEDHDPEDEQLERDEPETPRQQQLR